MGRIYLPCKDSSMGRHASDRGSRCAGPQSPLTRRRFLQVGALSATGLCLSDLLRLRDSAQAGQGTQASGPDTAVLLVWLSGGPPHHETYDCKPDAPQEI